jgi:short-subunit dehydrogenase
MSATYAVITGATGGLGRTLAESFWHAGYSLHLVGRELGALHQLREGLSSRLGQTCMVAHCDLSVPAAVCALGEALSQGDIRVDVLINNAAVQGPIGPAWINDIAGWEAAIQVNLVAPMAICRAVVPKMIAAGGGSIINLSGGGATGPRPNFSAYASAKAALVRFSETLAQEAKPHGVKVNCIAPGAMKTSMMDQVLAVGTALAGAREIDLATQVVADGGSSMARVAELALFLASSASEGITGKLISAVWDDWQRWPQHLSELETSDVYTLRRIVGRDRGFTWGDK